MCRQRWPVTARPSPRASDEACCPRRARRAVIGQLASWTGQDNGTRSWFLEFVAKGPPRMRQELEAAAAHATVGVEEFRSWLRETYLPAADGTPDAVGRERYLLSARWTTGTDIDVTETYHWALEEFHRTATEMRTAADRSRAPGVRACRSIRSVATLRMAGRSRTSAGDARRALRRASAVCWCLPTATRRGRDRCACGLAARSWGTAQGAGLGRHGGRLRHRRGPRA
ncbi:DUF885 family protein [Streptomyces triculaminicus]|uniref:DUF885 family protein n=1 Tax=Streptomyces triculaminicus TaxID=2816232 RepID=A0A939JUD2_9ACTN|nr:DUF885 family protein [Streptomyces triculaminicus]